jgi:tripartite-type tricarboxylate transporter receptor subunit TctC
MIRFQPAQAARTLVAALLGTLLIGAAAHAQSWPSRPIRWVVPYPAGGGTDQVSRLVAEKLATALGQPVIVDNKPGASTIIGAEFVAKAAPDGYTLLLGQPTSLSVNQSLYAKLPYDPVNSFTPIVQLVRYPLFLVVAPETKVDNAKDLFALAKKEPLAYATGGNGSIVHLGTEMVKDKLGLNLTHVPFKAMVQAAPEVAAGRVPFMFADMPAVRPFIQAGKLKVLATAEPSRSSLYPSAPTLAEAGLPGLEFSTWVGLVAPKGTPKPIVDRLASEVQKILAMPEVRERFAAMGVEGAASSPEQFGRFIDAESVKWSAVIKANAIKPE